jgi:hexosaminidase
LDVCRVFCGPDIGTLWPKPSGPIKFDRTLKQISIEKINLNFQDDRDAKFWKENQERFLKQLTAKLDGETLSSGGVGLTVKFHYQKDSSGMLVTFTKNFY